MKMALETGWLRCKAALESAARIDMAQGNAWLEANERYATQTLMTRWVSKPGNHFEVASILLCDLVEERIGLTVDRRLPNPPDDTEHYKGWLRDNCFRLSEQLRSVKPDGDSFSWLRRQYLSEHGRLVR